MKSFLVRLSSFVGFTGGLFVVAPVAAQPESECADNSDCESGYECSVTAVSGCSGAAPADCPPDEDCAALLPECETMEYRSCVPMSGCESDADCAENMVCLSYEMGTCTDVACAPGEDCPDIEPMCETNVRTQCTERWNAPCEVAADCGEGFECQYYEECSCSGGVTPSAPAMMPQPAKGDDADAEDPPEAALPLPAPMPPDEPTCECQPSEYGSCKVVEVECEEDSDCPSDWSCEQQYQDAPCGIGPEPTMMGGGSAGTGASGAEDLAPAPIAPPQEDPLPPEDDTAERPAPDVDGGADTAPPPPVDCEPLPAKSVCMPPGYYGSPATPTPGDDNGGENSGGEDPIAEPQEPPAPSEPSTDDEDAPGAEPDAGAPVSGPAEPEDDEEPAETDDKPSADDEAQGDDEAEGDDGKDEEDGPELAPVDDGERASDDGCNVAASGVNGSTSGAALTGLLGLVGLALVRRRRS